MERFQCHNPNKAREILNRRVRRARSLEPNSDYDRGEPMLLRDGSLVMVMDPSSRVIVTCYPHSRGEGI